MTVYSRSLLRRLIWLHYYLVLLPTLAAQEVAEGTGFDPHRTTKPDGLQLAVGDPAPDRPDGGLGLLGHICSGKHWLIAERRDGWTLHDLHRGVVGR